MLDTSFTTGSPVSPSSSTPTEPVGVKAWPLYDPKGKDNDEVLVNIMRDCDLKRNILNITNTYAKIVANTAGPYGKNTIIQTADRTYSTKDGWTVAQAVTVKEDPSIKSLAKMILDVSASVNRKVGDGTTTSILVANNLLKYVTEYMETHKEYTSKQIELALEDAVKAVCDRLNKKAQFITNENLWDVIHQIALESTNWDEEFARMIADIYKETGNPIINIQNSGSDKSYVEYVDGYDVKAQLQLQNYYLLKSDENGCVKLTTPMVVVFDYNMPGRLFNQMCLMAQFASQSGCPLVVLAPGFESEFINQISSYNIQQLQNKQPILPLFPVKYFLPSYVERDMIDDLCALLGAQMVTKENVELENLMGDLYNYMFSSPNKPKPGDTEEELKAYDEKYATYCKERDELINQSYTEFQKVAGRCETCSISDKKFEANGLYNKVSELVENRLKKLEVALAKKMKEADSMNFITSEMYPTRIRLGKLHCKMGTIYVGGYGDSNLSSKRAALDDATRACESAYLYGYTIGGGYAAPRACHELLEESFGSDSSLTRNFIEMIQQSFVETLYAVAINKTERPLSEYKVSVNMKSMGMTLTPTTISIDNAINYTIECGQDPFNLITENFDESMIEPAALPVEVLKASLRVVMISATSNQYLYKEY